MQSPREQILAKLSLWMQHLSWEKLEEGGESSQTGAGSGLDGLAGFDAKRESSQLGECCMQLSPTAGWQQQKKTLKIKFQEEQYTLK